ncbi:hypothetical protein TNCV_3632851 [Trichonephila clavipes]|nr:hypothetical protein TNCV_3632851 [Trichonephila clavipes]
MTMNGHGHELMAVVNEQWVLNQEQQKNCHVERLIHVKSVESQNPPVVRRKLKSESNQILFLSHTQEPPCQSYFLSGSTAQSGSLPSQEDQSSAFLCPPILNSQN